MICGNSRAEFDDARFRNAKYMAMKVEKKKTTTKKRKSSRRLKMKKRRKKHFVEWNWALGNYDNFIRYFPLLFAISSQTPNGENTFMSLTDFHENSQIAFSQSSLSPQLPLFRTAYVWHSESEELSDSISFTNSFWFLLSLATTSYSRRYERRRGKKSWGKAVENDLHLHLLPSLHPWSRIFCRAEKISFCEKKKIENWWKWRKSVFELKTFLI